MKKLLSILLILAMVCSMLVLVACDKGDEDNADGSSSSTTQKQKTAEEIKAELDAAIEDAEEALGTYIMSLELDDITDEGKMQIGTCATSEFESVMAAEKIEDVAGLLATAKANVLEFFEEQIEGKDEYSISAKRTAFKREIGSFVSSNYSSITTTLYTQEGVNAFNSVVTAQKALCDTLTSSAAMDSKLAVAKNAITAEAGVVATNYAKATDADYDNAISALDTYYATFKSQNTFDNMLSDDIAALDKIIADGKVTIRATVAKTDIASVVSGIESNLGSAYNARKDSKTTAKTAAVAALKDYLDGKTYLTAADEAQGLDTKIYNEKPGVGVNTHLVRLAFSSDNTRSVVDDVYDEQVLVINGGTYTTQAEIDTALASAKAALFAKYNEYKKLGGWSPIVK